MRAWYWAAGLLVSFACAKVQESRPSQTLTILFQFEQPYPDRALAEAQRELSLLTKSAPVRLEWYDCGRSAREFILSEYSGAGFPGELRPCCRLAK